MKRDKIRVLTVSGTPFEMGYTHGETYRDEIRRYAAERVHLVMQGKWSGGVAMSREAVLRLAEQLVPAHEAFSADLTAEMRGMAAATDLSLGELIVVSGFTDFVDTVYAQHQTGNRIPLDDCTAFIVPDNLAEGQGFFGQTWDMHDTATEFVILLDVQYADLPNAYVFTTTGCFGQLGMNDAGLAIGINNLMAADGQIGVTWPFVVRKMLQQRDADAALEVLRTAQLAGGHNFLIFDKSGKGYNVEAFSTRIHVTELQADVLVHTNHCLVDLTLGVAQARPADLQRTSEARLLQGEKLLQQHPITVETLQAVTRDPEAICYTGKPPYHVETCGAAIMRPKTGEFWAVWGLPSENEYERFTL
jgi:isopenicillin-N N-acyltransferase-like protein